MPIARLSLIRAFRDPYFSSREWRRRYGRRIFPSVPPCLVAATPRERRSLANSNLHKCKIATERGRPKYTIYPATMAVKLFMCESFRRLPPASITNRSQRSGPTKEIRGQRKSPHDSCGAMWNAPTARLVVRGPPGVRITGPQVGIYQFRKCPIPPRLTYHCFPYLPFIIFHIYDLPFYTYSVLSFPDMSHCRFTILRFPTSPTVDFTILPILPMRR